jgi:hypothetical protein
MTILFTPEELVRYLYNDISPEKAAAIDAALEQDWTLREKIEVLKASSNNLDRIIESPRQEVILRVLNYARETAVETA